MEVLINPIGNHFATYVYQIIILFTLNSHVVCQSYLNKAGEKVLLAHLVEKKRCLEFSWVLMKHSYFYILLNWKKKWPYVHI